MHSIFEKKITLGSFNNKEKERKMLLRYLCAVITLFTVMISSAHVHDPRALLATPETATGPIAPKLKGLGSHHFQITTTNQESQYFFNQGFRLTIGFNHSEALRAFKEAVRLDPNNAMAYWGWALALGPNLNLPMQAGVVTQTYTAIQKAMSLKSGSTPREQAYIEALATRYSNKPQTDRSMLDKTYVAAMAKLVERYPEDLDAATLYAAAMMNTNPWDYWYKDGTPKHQTDLVIATLQSVIDRDKNHAGAHHYMIHVVEAFKPELGIDSADQLGNLMPGAGHLVHMPSHIYMRVGRYADSYKANALAVKADSEYITQCRAQGLYPLGYYPHNLHFLTWSAMFQGRSQSALEAARAVEKKIATASSGDTWGLFESFRSQPMFVMVRFGLWDRMLEEPQPEVNARFMNAIWHYGRGLALTKKGKLQQAKAELTHLAEVVKLIKNDQAYIGFGAAETLLAIAEKILAGELAAKQNNFHDAISYLEKAVRLEDGLMYNEPPSWYFPVRHILGAVLLEAKLPGEAEVVYWEDLRRNPANGYSLFGLKQSLVMQNKSLVALEIEQRLINAWQESDVNLTTSRY